MMTLLHITNILYLLFSAESLQNTDLSLIYDFTIAESNIFSLMSKMLTINNHSLGSFHFVPFYPFTSFALLHNKTTRNSLCLKLIEFRWLHVYTCTNIIVSIMWRYTHILVVLFTDRVYLWHAQRGFIRK